MDVLSHIALAGGLAWASGIRLYATVFVFGLLDRLGYVALPQSLELLASDGVLWTAGILTVGEFIADKVPWFDSLWDALHTFIRVPVGMLLAWGALDHYGAGAQIAAALIGGAITSGTHLTKAGARAAINHSPEPFSNWTASAGEDVLTLGGLWLIVQYPLVFLLLLVVFLALVIWLLPKLWRALSAVFRKLGRRREPALGGSASGTPATSFER
jgi:hypothetical protein